MLGAAAISLHGAAANSATVYFGTTGASGNTIGRLAYDFSANAMAFLQGTQSAPASTAAATCLSAPQRLALLNS
jgi:hypothetical protein